MPNIEMTKPCWRRGNTSSRMVWPSGSSGAPNPPCMNRQNTRASSDWDSPHIERRGREADQAPELHRAAPEAADQPARHRRAHGGGQDVERHRPGDLVLRRRHRPLHLRQDGGGREGGGIVGARGHHDGDEHEVAPCRRQPEDRLVCVAGHGRRRAPEARCTRRWRMRRKDRPRTRRRNIRGNVRSAMHLCVGRRVPPPWSRSRVYVEVAANRTADRSRQAEPRGEPTDHGQHSE